MAGDQIHLCRLDHANGDIGIAPEQIVDGIGGDDLDLEVRVLPAQTCNDARQDEASDYHACGNADRAPHFPLAACGSTEDRIGRVAHGADIGEERRACLGDFLALRRASEQGRPDAAFKLGDVSPKRRLACVQLFCSCRQASCFDDGEEALE